MEKIFVTKPFLPPIDEYIEELKKIWDRKILTNGGPEYAEFNEALQKYLNIKNISLFTNGHIALETAIKAMNLTGEVITTPFTFISTTHAIVNNNLKPVFCDIKETDYTIDETKIESLITDKTSAIIAVHVYGYPCNVEAINKIARKHNLKVIYDSAHAFGVKLDSHSIFEYGDLSMCSFHATKVFNTIEGGMIISKDNKLLKKVELLKNYGITGPETIDEIGTNGKMSEFQAAMGIASIKYIESIIQKRKQLTLKYREELSKIPGIKLYEENDLVSYNYAYMPILIDEKLYGINRDELYEALKAEGIYSRKYFYPLTCDVNCYKNRFCEADIPVARYVSNRILTLPLYPDLTEDEQKCIINKIKNRGKTNE